MRNVIFVFLLFLTACSSSEELEYGIYVVNGETIYQENCANCHGIKGEGLRNLYPALKDSEKLGNISQVICGIKNGINTDAYPQAMPANSKLFDLDIAQLLTYMNKEFAGNHKKIDVEEVKDALVYCGL